MSVYQQNSEGIDEGSISKALEMARSRRERAERERAELDVVIAEAREEERLLLGLLALRRGELKSSMQATSSAEGGASNSTGTRKPQPDGPPTQPAVQAVIAELTAAGRPLHISELMRLLHDRKIEIPGAGTQANLITHLRRDTRLVRPSRGMYGLVHWGLEDMPPTVVRRRRKRRVRASAILPGSTL